MISLSHRAISPKRRLVPVLLSLALLLTTLPHLPVTAADAESLSGLRVSTNEDRSNDRPIEDGAVSGAVYIFLTQLPGAKQVRYHLNDPVATKHPYSVRTERPFDVEGGTRQAASPFDTTKLPDGSHTLTARVEYANGRVDVLQSSFKVANAEASAGAPPDATPTPPPDPEPEPHPDPEPEPEDGLPADWQSVSIGNPTPTGSATHEAGTFSVSGAGANIWDNADQFHYSSRTLDGDGMIIARVLSQTNTHHWAKAGVMLRPNLTPSSRHVSMFVTPGRGTAFQRRVTDSDISHHTAGPGAVAPYWVRLVREDNTITAAVSSDGHAWATVGSQTLSLPATVHIGLAVTSQTDGTLSDVTFDNVSVTEHSSEPPSQPESVGDAEWKGVLHTDYDVELWRTRRSGHAFSFDWNRIVAHKDAFMSNPGHQLNWDGSNWETSSGCVNTPQSNYQASLPPHVGPRRLRDAAFYSLVAYDAPDAATVRQQVASRLLSIAAINNHDMSNRSRFCYSSRNWDLPPYFDYAQWWSHIFLAYDFLGRDAFTASQRNTLDRFFYHAADAFRGQNSVVNINTSRWGPGRFNEPPSWDFSGASCSNFGAAWEGGPNVPAETTYIQNRKAFNSFHMTAIGLYLRKHGFTPPPSNPGHSLDQIISGGRALAHETLTVYWGPNATFSELHRASASSPNQGIFYQAMTNGFAALTAEMFARLGDTSLINYQPTAGVCGWQSNNTSKSFGYAAKSIAEYHARVYSNRRWNNVVIDGGSSHVADSWTAITNAWWNDTYVRAGYMRQHANNRPWPSSPAGLHGASGWETPGSTLPGVLFMFGQREGDRTVYGG